MPVEIVPDDQISRCIVYSRAFDGDVHVDTHLWPFGQSKDDGAAHESAVLRRLAENDNDVHRIGCSIARKQNAERDEPAPGPKRRYYCGFRTATVGDLPTKGDGYRIVIANIPEDGEASHVDVALFIDVSGKNARALRRTDAGLALAEHFGMPTPHVCDCDSTDDHHPINAFGAACLTSQQSSAKDSVR